MQFKPFIQYCTTHIKGDEKGEAQIFLDRFFVALGYAEGLKGAGADLEFRVKAENQRSTNFADLVWKPRVLIEMKKCGEDLSIHYQQAFSYWQRLVPNRPRYVILCNFDEFWIYDFDKDIYEPQEKIELAQLQEHKEAFSFLLPVAKKPLFKNNKEDVTEKVAQYVSQLYKSLAKNKSRKPMINDEDAIRYCIQCVLCLFAEDIELLPNKIFSRLIKECAETNAKGFDKVPETYDLIGGLFKEMNLPGKTPAGKYKDVDYFNGGLFQKIIPIELEMKEVELLEIACDKKWQHINPAIFGSIFEGLMDSDARHKAGAHYTHETDIKRIVDPVIVQPWRRKIDAVITRNDNVIARNEAISPNDKQIASGKNPRNDEKQETINKLFELHIQLTNYKVLDPACGSGNFLFIAYKELKLIEKEIFKHLHSLCSKRGDTEKIIQHKLTNGMVSTKQFYGIDQNPTAVELAKVTLMIAKELSITEAFDNEEALPLDNLDNNIICADALFTKWVEVDAIIGNPPFQARSKMLSEFGREYLNKLWAAYPEMNKYADFCTYWFYKAHKHLKQDSYAGFVGTNTIRENNSRESSLDYIVNNGGEIFNAVSSVDWSGAAAVFVSIVCWKKGEYNYNKLLYTSDKKNLVLNEVQNINSSLSINIDVANAKYLNVNNPKEKHCFMGQKHGHKGFLLSKKDAIKLINEDKRNNNILHPYLNGSELLSNLNSQPERFVIDFSELNINEASTYKKLYQIITKNVLPQRELDAAKENLENEALLKKDTTARQSKSYQQYLNTWWQLIGKRPELIKQLASLNRYAACSAVSSRPIFEFVSTEIRPNAALIVFTFNDYYSFGIIQSNVHWEWWKAKCSTLKGDYRYTIDPVWDTFPFPQKPTQKQVEKVAKAARALHLARTQALQQHHLSLRDLYRLLEQPGKNLIKDLHTALDIAVLEAYNFNIKPNDANGILSHLLALNETVANKEKNEEEVTAPGLPPYIKNKEQFISEDCVRFEWE